MSKKLLYALLVLPMVLILAACASLPIPGIGAAQAQSNQSNQRNGGFNADPSKMPVQQKLGIGILKLEGTPQAITPDQAKQLLPLWKAVKALSTSNNASADEITALYKQIQDVLTPDQVQAITKLTWTQAELQATMQQYGVQFRGFGGNGTPSPAQETRIAQFRAQGGGNGGNGGNGGFGGGGQGGFGGGGGGFGGNGGQGGTTAQRTPAPGAQARRAAGGFNNLFADAVIKLLTQKAGS